MARRFARGKLVVATHNAGKVREIRELLAPYGVETVSAGELNLPEPEETETTFVGNATLKARAAARASGLPALADDSGFGVEALGGAPGVYAKDWAGPDVNFARAMQAVWDKVQESGSPDRRAWFACVLALAWPDGGCEAFEGRVAGEIVWPPRGALGFGYDPMFVPQGEARTYGEMSAAEKHRDSHRARAFRQLIEACFG